MIYFIYSPTNQVKIGEAGDVHLRFAQLQAASPVALTLLGVSEGGRELEQQLHRELADSAAGNGWFHLTAQVKRTLERFDVSVSPQKEFRSFSASAGRALTLALEELPELCEKRGFTFGQLAKLSAVAPGYLRPFAQKEPCAPARLDLLAAVLETLGVPVADWFECLGQLITKCLDDLDEAKNNPRSGNP